MIKNIITLFFIGLIINPQYSVSIRIKYIDNNSTQIHYSESNITTTIPEQPVIRTQYTASDTRTNNDPYYDNATKTSVIILISTFAVLVGYIIIRFIVILVKKYKKHKISNYKY